VYKKFKKLFDKSDWMDDGPGRVFFVRPPNFISDFIWCCYLNQSMLVGQFLLAGTHPDAISHTFVDTILTKDFWRSHLEGVGARVPRQLGRYSNAGELKLDYPLGESDLVVKIPDAYLGIGDSFWNHGRDYKTEEDLKVLLAKNYVNKEAMILELVRPKKELGVHSLDIVTIRVPGGGVKVLSVLLWTDCTTDSSHSCQAGYVVDIESETVISPASWYCAAFAKMNAPLIGSKYPGVKAACEKAIAAHLSCTTEQWLVAVGWDCMVMSKNELVFFEGNFAGARTPRRMFLSAIALFYAIQEVFWPFGGSVTSVTPTSNMGSENSAKKTE